MARKEQTYRVNGKEISIVTCENAGAGRKGNKGVYFDDKTYVLKSNADATEEMIKKLGPDHSKWKERSWQVHNRLWNVTLAQMLLSLLPKI